MILIHVLTYLNIQVKYPLTILQLERHTPLVKEALMKDGKEYKYHH